MDTRNYASSFYDPDVSMIIHIFQLPVCRILQLLQEPLVSSACQDGYLVCILESRIQNSNEICVCCEANIHKTHYFKNNHVNYSFS